MRRDRVALSLGVQTKRYRPYGSWQSESNQVKSIELTSRQVKSSPIKITLVRRDIFPLRLFFSSISLCNSRMLSCSWFLIYLTLHSIEVARGAIVRDSECPDISSRLQRAYVRILDLT